MKYFENVCKEFKNLVYDCSYAIFELNKDESVFSKPLIINIGETISCNKGIKSCYFKYFDYIIKNKLICIIDKRQKKYIRIAKRYGISYLQYEDNIFIYSDYEYDPIKVISKYNSEKKYINDDINSYATPTGQIGMHDVRIELGKSGQISLNDSDVRGLAGKSSGQIAMSDLRGKSSSYKIKVEPNVNSGFTIVGCNGFSSININSPCGKKLKPMGSLTPNTCKGFTIVCAYVEFFENPSDIVVAFNSKPPTSNIFFSVPGVGEVSLKYTSAVGSVHFYTFDHDANFNNVSRNICNYFRNNYTRVFDIVIRIP